MSDQIIREISVIRRYSRHNEAEDLRFRAYLKAGLNLSNRELDTIVEETTEAVWKQIDCTACANCCKTLQIVVDDQDIARLASRLKMPVRQFARTYVGIDGDGTKHFRSSPCAFLGEDNKCTVYDDRPQACRDFPYLHEQNFRSRSLMMLENTGTCPIVFNVWQSLKRRFWPRKR